MAESESEHVDRRAVFEPIVGRVVDALGGYEGGLYRMGDDVLACLRDLKKLWRTDDDDDDRTVARILVDSRVFHNDLVPILLATAHPRSGTRTDTRVPDKRALACADLLTALTWPIDVAAELRELDEANADVDGAGRDYATLTQSHVAYKAALLAPGVLSAAVTGLLMPPLQRPVRERTPQDAQVVNLVLHLVRNVAFIRDAPADAARVSVERAGAHTGLQSRLVRVLSEARVLDVLCTLASNHDDDPLFRSLNTLVLEILYLLFRAVKPADLAADQTKVRFSILSSDQVTVLTVVSWTATCPNLETSSGRGGQTKKRSRSSRFLSPYALWHHPHRAAHLRQKGSG